MALDVSLCANDCWFRLGFSNLADMSAANTWVTTAELFQFADDAVKALARSTALFLTYDETTTVVPGAAQYPLVARHVFTESAWLLYAPPAAPAQFTQSTWFLIASLAMVFTQSASLLNLSGSAVQLLRITGAAQLFALDAAWPAAAPGPPVRLSLDAADVYTGTLYPPPAASATLATVLEVYPPDVTAGASVVPVTPILQDAVTLAMIAGALGKESDSAKPEVAKHCQERLAMYLAIVQKLWGVA